MTLEDTRFFVYERRLPVTPIDRPYKFVTEFSKKADATTFGQLYGNAMWMIVVFRDGQAVSVTQGWGKTITSEEEEIIEIE